MRKIVFVLGCSALVACDVEPDEPGGGPHDALVADGGRDVGAVLPTPLDAARDQLPSPDMPFAPEASAADAAADVSAPEAGTTDAPAVDAVPVDAPAVDAATVDAPAADAPAVDASPEAGTPDRPAEDRPIDAPDAAVDAVVDATSADASFRYRDGAAEEAPVDVQLPDGRQVDVPPGYVASGSSCGIIQLYGLGDHGGTTVTLEPGGHVAISDRTGRFCFDVTGTFSLRLQNGPYEDWLPKVVLVPGTILLEEKSQLRTFGTHVAPRARFLSDLDCSSGVADDGSRVLVRRCGGAGGHVAVLPLLNPGLRPVMVQDHTLQTWTNFSTHLLYLDQESATTSSLISVPLDGVPTVRIGSGLARDSRRLEWVGDRVVYGLRSVVGSWDKLLVFQPSAGAGSGPLTLAPAASGFLLAAGNTRVVYRDGDNRVASVRLDGTDRHELSDPGAKEVQVSPDGQYAVFVLPGQSGIARVDGGGSRLLSQANSTFIPVFTPDSQQVIWESNGSIYTQPVAGGATTRIVQRRTVRDEDKEPARPLLVAPAGYADQLLYLIDATHSAEQAVLLRRIALPVGAAVDLGRPSLSFVNPGNLRLSADGRAVSFYDTTVASGKARLVSLDTGLITDVPSGYWSRNGDRYWAVRTSDFMLVSIDPHTGALREHVTSHSTGFALSPNGKAVAMEARYAAGRLQILDVASGASFEIAPAGSYYYGFVNDDHLILSAPSRGTYHVRYR